jgi:hypothetical protein
MEYWIRVHEVHWFADTELGKFGRDDWSALIDGSTERVGNETENILDLLKNN